MSLNKKAACSTDVHSCSDHLKSALMLPWRRVVLSLWDLYSTRMSPEQRSQQLKVMFS